MERGRQRGGALSVAARVIQISDTHLSAVVPPGDPFTQRVRENWEALKAWLATVDADLVVHTGDLIRNEVDHAADRTFAAAELASLGGDVVAVPGNHDVGHAATDDPAASAEGPISEARVAAYRAAWGEDRFARRVGGWWLVGVNAHLLGSGLPQEREQEDWLRGVAAESAGAPLALFLHLPLFTRAPGVAEAPGDRTLTVPLGPRLRLFGLLGDGLRLVACGHLHQARSAVADGVAHVWGPSVAFTIEPGLFPVPMEAPSRTVGALEYRLGEGSLSWGAADVPGLHPLVLPRDDTTRDRD